MRAVLVSKFPSYQWLQRYVNDIIPGTSGSLVIYLDVQYPSLGDLLADNVSYNGLDFRFVGVNHTEGRKVGTTILQRSINHKSFCWRNGNTIYLEVFQVDSVSIQAGQQVIVVLRDHSNLLSLFQHLTNCFLLAIQDDVSGLAQIHLFQNLIKASNIDYNV